MRHRRPGCRPGASPHRGPAASTSSVRFRVEDVAEVLRREAVGSLEANRATALLELHPGGALEGQGRRVESRSLTFPLSLCGAVRPWLERQQLQAAGPRALPL